MRSEKTIVKAVLIAAFLALDGCAGTLEDPARFEEDAGDAHVDAIDDAGGVDADDASDPGDVTDASSD